MNLFDQTQPSAQEITPCLYGLEHDLQAIETEQALAWWNRFTFSGKQVLSSLYNFSGQLSIREIYIKYHSTKQS